MLSREKFKEFLNTFERGLDTPYGVIKLDRLKQGRFIEEFNLDLSLEGESLLTMKVFLGRKPYYGEWVEVFGIKPELKGKYSFFGSPVEEAILNSLSPYFSKVFIEYFEDKETARELQKGVPPALSRMGYELLKRGYTYFRDWYIPEGLMEGGHKIQAEKPKSEEIKERHLEKIREEFEVFRGRCEDKELLRKVEARAKTLLGF
ncbi:DUF1122 family protein [Aquifex sp.]